MVLNQGGKGETPVLHRTSHTPLVLHCTRLVLHSYSAVLHLYSACTPPVLHPYSEVLESRFSPLDSKRIINTADERKRTEEK